MNAITAYLSRYRLVYVRSLVYMLQSCEYSIHDFFIWYKRINDFSHVEYRKHLEFTPKASMLAAFGWIVQAALYLLVIWHLFIASYLWVVILAALLPYILLLFLLAFLLVMRLVQTPAEYLIIRRAAKKLARHKGLKIAIAGSYGKTSMREILRTVLSVSKRVASPEHNYNTPIGIARFVQHLKGDEEVLIFELGEYYPGDVEKLCRLVRPDIGIITGVSEAHLERFGTIEKAAATIFELADWLGSKPVYVNSDSTPTKAFTKPSHILYNKDGVHTWKVSDARSDLSGTSFILSNGSRILRFKSALLGLHQVGPLSMVAALADFLGLSSTDIEIGIARTKPFAHRLELKHYENGAYKLDDSYNGNPAGVEVVISFMAGLKGHRRFYVTPGLREMGPRTEEVHKEIGRQIARARIEKTVLIRNSVTPFIETGLRDAGYHGEVIWFEDALKAYAALPHMTIQGDVVLLQNDWPDQYV